MRRLKSLPICLALTSALLLAPARAAVAQLKPAVVVSVTSVSEMMNDIQYLARAAGAPEMAGLVTLLTAQYTQFLDANKPGGVYVVFSGVNEPVAIGFLPVKDQDALLAKLAEQIGQPEDAGNGIQKINGPQPMFLKAANGYTFVSNADANLANLPQDPAALLGGLDKSYNLAVQINPQSIPPELRKMAISQMKSSFEMQLEQQEQPEGVDAELQKKLARNSMDQMAKLIDDSERILIGWAVDADGSST